MNRNTIARLSLGVLFASVFVPFGTWLWLAIGGLGLAGLSWAIGLDRGEDNRHTDGSTLIAIGFLAILLSLGHSGILAISLMGIIGVAVLLIGVSRLLML